MNLDIERGISTWSVGFRRLVDLVVVLHARNELELETVCAASKHVQNVGLLLVTGLNCPNAEFLYETWVEC